MGILTPYRYLHYRIYDLQLKAWGEEYVPEFNALFLVSLFCFLNVYFLIDLVSLAAGVNLLKARFFRDVGALFPLFSIVGISYVILLRGGRYKEAAKQFAKESRPARIRNSILCLAYVGVSLLLAFGWHRWFPVD